MELNPYLVEGAKVKVVPTFFDETFTYEGDLDAVVHSHVFEHMYFPSDFISQLGDFIPIGKYHLFSIPDLMLWLKNKFTNCLNFEHTYFVIEPYVEYLLAINGFKVLKKEKFLDHSLFYATQKVDKKVNFELPNLYEQNKQLFDQFVQYH